MARRYRLTGINDDFDTCSCCGRTGLKRVAMLTPLDPDGNPEGDAEPYGTSCAATLLGYTWDTPAEQRKVKKLLETEALQAEVAKLEAIYQGVFERTDLGISGISREANRWGAPVAKLTIDGREFRGVDRGPEGRRYTDAEVIQQAKSWLATNLATEALPKATERGLHDDIRHAFYLRTHICLYPRF